METPFLSLIIPAFNEEHRLPRTLDQVSKFLEQQSYSFEVLVVDNASTDNTSKIVKEFSEHHSYLHGIREPIPGKGSAVRTGMLAARGSYRFMADADLSMPIDQIPRFLPPLTENVEIAIGSREAEGAVRFEEPIFRHLGGRGMNTMIQLLALPGLQDTQCGFKCFTARSAEDLFRSQTMTGWSFDIELLFIARRRGYRIQEIAIPWYYRQESKVNPVKDSFQMLIDLLTIRQNASRGVYDKKN